MDGQAKDMVMGRGSVLVSRDSRREKNFLG